MFGSKRFMNYQKKQLAPDLTPLIDVVFLLLIFFMVATTFDDRGGMRIELPKSQLAKPEEVTEKISVLVTKDFQLKLKVDRKDGSTFVDITKEELKTKLEKEIAALKDKRVSILADRDMDYGQVVDIMSDIKAAGAQSIDIETKRK